MRFNYRILWIFLVGLVLATGCKEDDIIINTDIDGKWELEMPVIKFTYSLADVIRDVDEDIIKIGEDGLIYLSYYQEVFLDWENLVELSDDFWNHEPEIINAPALKSSQDFNFQHKARFNSRDDVRYDSLSMHSGNFTFELMVPAGTSGTVNFNISVPEFFDNGIPVTINRSITVTESQTQYAVTIPLSGYFVRFSHNEDETISYVTINTTMSADLSGSGEFQLSDINLDFSMTEMKPEIVFGYFSQQASSSYDAELVFNAFEEFEVIEGIEFGGVSLELITYNSIGVPFSVKADNIRFFKEEESTTPDWQLTIDGGDFVEMDVSTAIYGIPVQPGEGYLKVDQGDDSNLMDIINGYPIKLLCDLHGQSNPNGPDPQQDNFMGMDSQLLNELIINLPLWFRVDNYSRKDTLDFDFNDMIDGNQEDVEKIDGVSVYLDFSSTLPIALQARVLVVDENGETIEDLLNGMVNVIKAGIPGSGGKVVTPVHTEFVISITGAQIKRFISENVKSIILETIAATPDNQNSFVKIYEDSKLETIVSFSGVASQQ